MAAATPSTLQVERINGAVSPIAYAADGLLAVPFSYGAQLVATQPESKPNEGYVWIREPASCVAAHPVLHLLAFAEKGSKPRIRVIRTDNRSVVHVFEGVCALA